VTAGAVHALNFTDVLIMVGILGYLIDRFADARGWSRTSKTLRRENEDLVRRNAELEEAVKRLDGELTRLKAQVEDLKRRDQTAVLVALKEHELGAKHRHSENQDLHKANQALLQRAVNALEGGAG
jgi:predicted RNase H-like nuclease (RuvC/YqgF family)